MVTFNGKGKPVKITIFAMLILTLCGCTVIYKAEPNPMKVGMVEQFQSNATIQIINSQTSEDSQMENVGGGMTFKINPKELTDSAIELLKEELEKNGIETNNSSPKILNLSLDKLYMGNYIMAAGCTVTITVETNSGISKIFKRQNTSSLGIWNACDFAITKVVANIINDPEIRYFIDPTLSNM